MSFTSSNELPESHKPHKMRQSSCEFIPALCEREVPRRACRPNLAPIPLTSFAHIHDKLYLIFIGMGDAGMDAADQPQQNGASDEEED